MTLGTGTRIGAYEITGAIGAGGMGEVYRARDTKLHREAAIKVLPAAFAQDADGVARLRREAQVLASLSHPHIAAIYGLEEADGVLALALEYVEGDDLAVRLASGPLAVDEALDYARQIADGLDAAHEKGVVHRDLKPANLKVTPGGLVKILDFGLAKPDTSGVGRPGSNPAASPTITRHATDAGVILGTAAYMSPEQARGKPVDKRADIWAFGVVLFEMLAGRRLFPADTLSDTLAAVLTREPDWTLLPPTTPPGVRRLLARCLERDSKKRLRDIGDARVDLDDAGEPAGRSGSLPTRPLWFALPWGLAVAAALLAGWLAWRQAGAPGAQPDVVHVDIALPPDVEPVSLARGFAISPDGRTVMTVGMRGGVRRLIVRRLDRAEALVVPGTEGAQSAQFSPDSLGIVFVTSGRQLARLSLADRQQKTLASDADSSSGLAWTTAGIIFGRKAALWVVSPDGGDPRPLTVLDPARGEVLHDRPVELPGGRLVLFASQTVRPGEERIEVTSFDGGSRRTVVERATTPMWSPTGHLLFARDGAVLAAPFDQDAAATSGPAVPVMPSGVVEPLMWGDLAVRLSATGTLLYLPAGFGHNRVVSVGSGGGAVALDLPRARYAHPRVSPDGRHVLVESGYRTIEVLDLVRGTHRRLTPAAIGTTFPTWNADGTRVVFRRFNRPFSAATDGSGDPRPLAAANTTDVPAAPGPDPDSLLTVEQRAGTAADVFMVSITDAFKARELVATPAYEGGPQLSPDGRWLLYQSDGSGQAEIYVRRYPALDRPWQVSEGGGVQPRWSRTGREIYYRSSERVLAVPIDGAGTAPSLGRPTLLFAGDYNFGEGASIPNYDVTSERRFLMLQRTVNGGNMHAVINWTEELKATLAAGGVR